MILKVKPENVSEMFLLSPPEYKQILLKIMSMGIVDDLPGDSRSSRPGQ
jgi:hypothetical protein